MNRKEASALLNNIISGKEKDANRITEVYTYCAQNKATLHDLMSPNNMKKALEKGYIKAPETPAANSTKKAPAATLDEQAELVKRRKAEAAEKVKVEKDKFAKLQTIIKENSSVTPKPLFRAVWKEGRSFVGMEVLYIHPIATKRLHLIGIQLILDSDKNFKKCDNLQLLEVDSLDFDGKKIVGYDSEGKSLDVGIYFPATQEEPKTPAPKTAAPKLVRKKPASKKTEQKTETPTPAPAAPATK